MKGLAAWSLGGKPEWKRKTDYYPISNNMKKKDSDGLLVAIIEAMAMPSVSSARIERTESKLYDGKSKSMRCKFFMIDGSTQMFVVSKSIIQGGWIVGAGRDFSIDL